MCKITIRTSLICIAVMVLSANSWNAVVGLQQQQYSQSTPVPILKQINKQNGDGSYSYGYENADGSYKIETKYPNGEVLGKYGYVDDTGNLRDIEYGASRRGFEPAGTGITVPPPVIHEDKAGAGLAASDYDDGQYREDPSIYWKAEPSASSKLSVSSHSRTNQQQQQQHNGYRNTVPQYQPPSRGPANPAATYQQSYNSWNSPSNTNEFRSGVSSNPAAAADNFDPYSGSSYTITYNG